MTSRPADERDTTPDPNAGHHPNVAEDSTEQPDQNLDELDVLTDQPDEADDRTERERLHAESGSRTASSIGARLTPTHAAVHLSVDTSAPLAEPLDSRKWRLRIAATVASLYAIAGVALSPQFNTNDDTAMWGIVSGETYGAPSDHAIFINTIVTVPLRLLYTITDRVPWYALFFFSVQVLAVTISALAASRPAARLRRTLVAIGAIVFCLVSPLTVSYQFTAAAILLAGSGLTTWLALANMSADQAMRRRWFVLAGGLLGVSYLIRTNGAVAATVLVAPLLALAVWRSRDRWRSHAVAASAALFVVLLGVTASTLRYSGNEQWETFQDFNEPRSQLQSTPRLQPDDELAVLLDDIGWSWADRAMFDNWFYTNVEAFETADLNYLLAARSTVTDDEGFGDALSDLIARYSYQWAVLAAITVLLGLRTTWSTRAALVGSMVWFVTIGVALSMFLRFPPRVAEPMFVVSAFASLAAAARKQHNRIDHEARAGRRLSYGIIGATLMLVGASVIGLWSMVSGRSDRADRSENRTAEFHVAADVAGPDGVIVNWGGFLSFQNTNPFLIERHPGNELDIVGLGWRARSPPFDAQLAGYGIGSLELAVADDPDVVLVTTDKLAAIFGAFLFDHYDRREILWPEESIRNGVGHVYRQTVSARLLGGRLIIEGSEGSVARYTELDEEAEGEIELLADSPTSLGSVQGWALHPDSGTPFDAVIVTIDNEIAGYSDTRYPRPELVESRNDDRLATAGFFVALPANRIDPDVTVRVLALFGDTWAEVSAAP